MRLGTVGEHGPNLARTDTGARGFEDDMTAIGRPTGALVAALIAGQFNDLPGGGVHDVDVVVVVRATPTEGQQLADRKSTRLNSSHTVISYAVFCLKKKNNTNN